MKKRNPMEPYSTTPIGAVVLPLKQEAIARAKDEAKALIKRVRDKLAEGGWDLNAVAPYPKGNQTREEYRIQLGRYQLYSGLTEWDEAKPKPVFMNGPRYVKMSPAKRARFIEQAGENAAKQYDAFVFKLDAKIGPVKTASLAGNHVWGDSTLTVVTEAGNTERWHTQMIVNVSKYHLLFNQFPTRKLKESKK